MPTARSTHPARPRGRRRAPPIAAAVLATVVALTGSGTPTSAQTPPAVPLPAVTELVSTASFGPYPNGSSTNPSVNGTAVLVAYESRADNLIFGDTNGARDIFVGNWRTHTTSRVSVSSAEAQANDDSTGAAISASPVKVAFTSYASNLVPGDTNDSDDIFVRDLAAGTTTRISVTDSGGQANDDSVGAAISADGRWVAFTSQASNLVAGDSNGVHDIFVRDLLLGRTRRVSLSSTQAQGNDRSSGSPAISGDGRYVAFVSQASNLVPNDTNDPTPGQVGGGEDIFVRDRAAGTTTRVSVRSNGAQASGRSSEPAISADGRWVAFVSQATDLVGTDANGTTPDVFAHDRSTATTSLVSRNSSGTQANAGSGAPALSADGRYIAFHSYATNLVAGLGAGDTNNVGDVFVRDRVNQTTGRSSLTTDGAQATLGDSGSPAISADGSKVAFDSDAVNLGPTGPLTYDVFLRRPDPPLPVPAPLADSASDGLTTD